jgi:hypothetical protein
MKFVYLLIPFAAFFTMASASAQGKIWRCGNTYTNDEAQARTLQCKPVEGGNVTVVQGTRVNGAASASSNKDQPMARPTEGAASAPDRRVAASEQRSRDGEARAILEAELKKAEDRLAELKKEYNNGEPEKIGPEHKNYQKYLDRVADLKASIERTEKDIAGLKRELGRSNGSTPTANKQ